MTHDAGRKYCFFAFFKLDNIIFFFLLGKYTIFWDSPYKKIKTIGSVDFFKKNNLSLGTDPFSNKVAQYQINLFAFIDTQK